MADIATQSGFLARAREQAASEPMRELQRVTVNAKTLAVCERAGGTLVLAREHERGLFPGGNAQPAGDAEKRSRDHGTERYMKPTALLADFADAVEAGLL